MRRKKHTTSLHTPFFPSSPPPPLQTFGLKNKNRSKAVQKYVEVVTNSVKSSGSRDQRALDAEREKKKQEKMERQQKELEMKKLYGGVDADKKKKSEEEEEAAKMDENGEYLWTADDFDQVEEDDSRLEEQLEAERTALVGRSDLTPVNEDSFQKWWVQKKKSNEDAETKARKAQIKKFKQTGRGISGRALFEHDATYATNSTARNHTHKHTGSSSTTPVPWKSWRGRSPCTPTRVPRTRPSSTVPTFPRTSRPSTGPHNHPSHKQIQQQQQQHTYSPLLPHAPFSSSCPLLGASPAFFYTALSKERTPFHALDSWACGGGGREEEGSILACSPRFLPFSFAFSCLWRVKKTGGG